MDKKVDKLQGNVGKRYSELKDPLGELKRCATEIWEASGRPVGTTWEDFLEQAESRLLSVAGSGNTQANTKTVESGVGAERGSLSVASEEILTLRAKATDPLLKVLSSSFNRLLDEHESFCLAVLLSQNELTLSESMITYRCDKAQIGNVLSLLSNGYDPEFLDKYGVKHPSGISIEDRASYWKNKFEEWEDNDEPLHYNDRNTLERLRAAILGTKLVARITLR